MEAMRRSRGSADYRAATGVMRDILVKVVNESYEAQLRAIDVPVSLIWGSDDREVPVTIAERALSIINEGGGVAELEVVPGVGHLLPTEAPQALRRVVDEALES
jgi:pimeloyl-ACP methyl ester carboxylesterase